MSDQFNLYTFLRPLLRWWWMLVAAMLIAAFASFIYSASQPPLYFARATMMVGSSIQDPNPNGGEFYLANQLAETYADIANRAPLYNATMEALGVTWLPYFVVSQVVNRPVIQLMVYDEDPERAFIVADELVRQIILLGPREEQSRHEFVDLQLTKLQNSITDTEDAIIQRENELLTIDSARELANKQAEIRALQDKMTTMQRNYADLLATTQRGAVNAIRVLEPATKPTDPIASGLARNLLVAAMAGFALAAAGAYLLEFLDKTFRDGDEMKEALDVTLLGSVPTIPGSENNSAQRLITLQLGQTPTGEAYRRIRTNLDFASIDRALHLILVTSAQSRDGKSLTAANLSISLANSGKNVVLVDADLHRPSQQRLFKLPNNAGLTTALLAEDAKLDGLLQTTGAPRLSVLTSGPLPPNPAELLGSRRFHDILARLQTSVDIVVIDSPPVTAVVDSLILATQVDGLVMVVRAGKTHRDATRRTLDALRQVRAHILGAVFTDVPSPQMDLYNQQYGYYNVAYGRASAFGKPKGRVGSGRATAGIKPETISSHVNGKPSTVAPGSVSKTDQGQRTGVQDAPTTSVNGKAPRTADIAVATVDGLREQANGSFQQIVRRRSGLPWK